MAMPCKTQSILSQLTMNVALPSFLNSPAFPCDGIELTLPGIARDGDHGLGGVSKEVLEKCLQPIMRGLQNLDATSLLELKQAQHGARLMPG